MSAISEVEWESCLLPPVPDADRELHFRKLTGRPAGALRYFVGSDWSVDVMTTLSVLVAQTVHLPTALGDYVALVVSQDNSCRYCFAQARLLLRITGLPESRIRELELDLYTAELSTQERAGLAFARKLSRSNPLADASDRAGLLAAGYTDSEIVELAGLIAVHVFFNRAATLLALPPHRSETAPDQWYASLIRPLLKLVLRRVKRHGSPSALAPGEAAGPFSHVVDALDGLPLAHELRRLLDGAWQSKTLPPRCMALIFAVVARALGCQSSEAEAVRLAEADGMSREEIEQTLTHLSCAGLDPISSAVVPFARETVWYQPIQIQRRSKLLLEELSREIFLETVIAASLANAVCRLGVLSGDCR
jgi:AhpD family alkylhydroperoxidase